MSNLIQRFLQVLIFALFLLKISSCKSDKVEVPVPNPPKPPCAGCGILDYYAIDYEPAWSHDGKYIVYYHADKDQSKTGLYIITPEGKNNRLWHQSVASSLPSWSPDGQWITFSHGAQIWKKKFDGDSLTQLTNAGRNFSPSWSPDGKWIAYDSNDDSPTNLNFIWKMRTDGSDKIRIRHDTNNGEIRYPYWGKTNVISHIRFVGVGAAEVFLMDPDGNQVKRLTNDEIDDKYPRVSSKNQLIFLKQRVGETPKMWGMDAAGDGLKQITNRTGYVAEWSPDGNSIVYTFAINADGRLWIMDADGSNSRQLTFAHLF